MNEKIDIETPEGRKAWAEKLVRAIDASDAQQGQLPDRWERLEQLTRLQPVNAGVQLEEGDEPRTMPVITPLVDQLVANVCGPVLSQSPYFVAKTFGPDSARSEPVEQMVQWCLERAQFDRRFRKATRVTAKAEPAIFRVHFEDGAQINTPETDAQALARQGYVGPSISVIHPKNFVCYPLYAGGINKAKTVGYRFGMRAQEIKEKQAEGIYFEDAIVYGGDNPQDHQAGRDKDWSLTEESAGITDDLDQNVDVYELVTKEDFGEGKESWWICHVAKRDKCLLLAQPYGAVISEGGNEEFVPYSRPGYFEHFLHEPDEDEFYRSNPFAQNLQGIQLAFNDIINLVIDGNIHSAFPAGFTTSAGLMEKFSKYKAGTVYHVRDVNIVWTKPQMDNGVLLPMLEFLQQLAASVSKISQPGMGQEMKSGTTATEAAGVLAGQQTGLDEYRSNAMMGPTVMCDFIRELCYVHWPSLENTYGGMLPIVDPSPLASPVIWQPNGKTATNSPQALIQKIQLLIQLAPMLFGADPLTGMPNINTAELARVVLDALDLPIDVSKLTNPVAGIPQDVSGGPEMELLALLAQAAQGDGSGEDPNYEPAATG
jgi:hypothetical protein